MSYHKQGTFTCEVCETTFTSRAKFQNHVSSHKEGGNRCDECGKYFSLTSNLQFILESIRVLFNVLIVIKYFQEKNCIKAIRELRLMINELEPYCAD